jgi:hypothetical protein
MRAGRASSQNRQNPVPERIIGLYPDWPGTLAKIKGHNRICAFFDGLIETLAR